MAASSKTTLTSPKVLKSSKPRSSASFPGSSPLCHHTKSEKTSDTTSFLCSVWRRKIPFDFQRTTLAGLALESATSSGLERAPRSAMQDPIQAPLGATRQAGLYTS
ncbi:hypothetical protein TNCV_702051 [Trichonephila clavipes]|nr:hypothetical protein TNCV_702051 [Trichonephila clavipes]